MRTYDLAHIKSEDELIHHIQDILTDLEFVSSDEPYETITDLYYKMSIIGFFAGADLLSIEANQSTIYQRFIQSVSYNDNTSQSFTKMLAAHIIGQGGLFKQLDSSPLKYINNLFFHSDFFSNCQFRNYILFLCIFSIRVTKKHPNFFDEQFEGNWGAIIHKMKDEVIQRFLTRYLSLKYNHLRLKERLRYLLSKWVNVENVNMENIIANCSKNLAICSESFGKSPDLFSKHFDFGNNITNLPNEFGPYNLDSFFEIIYEGKYFSERDVYKLFIVSFLLHPKFVNLGNWSFPEDKYTYEKIFLEFFLSKDEDFMIWEDFTVRFISINEINERYPAFKKLF